MNKLKEMRDKARADWRTALLERDEDVAYAAKTKTGMGDNYWHAERATRLRYEAIEAVIGELVGEE
jgi:hypothetical protein